MTSRTALYVAIMVFLVWVCHGSEANVFKHDDVMTYGSDVYIFGVGGTRRPYNFENADGKLVGFDVDIVNAVCSEAKRECYTVLRRKEDCIFTDRNIDYAGEGLMSEAIQGCAGYQITTDRLNEFTFTLPYLIGQSTYAVKPGNPTAFNPELGDITKYRLVQASGSPFNAACLRRQGKKFGSILVVDTVSEARDAILNGNADVLLSTRVTIQGLDVLPMAVACDEGQGTGIILKQGSAVPGWWNSAFRHLYKSNAYHKLCKEAGIRYNATINCLPRSDQTETILRAISQEKATPTVLRHQHPPRLWKFVVSGRIAPYSFINDKGELTGFTKDFILNVCKIACKKCVLLLSEVNECSVRQGELLYPGRVRRPLWCDINDHSPIFVEIIKKCKDNNKDNGAKVMHATTYSLMSGWFDACTGYYNTVDRRNSWDFTDPYLVSNASFYVTTGNPTNFDPSKSDLSDFTIDTRPNNVVIPYLNLGKDPDERVAIIVYQATAITTDHCLHRLHKKAGKLKVVDDEDEAIEAVLSGKADAWFTKLVVPENQGLRQLPGRFHCEHVGTSIMVRKGSKLPAWWNKAYRKYVMTGGYHQFCHNQGKTYNSKLSEYCLKMTNKKVAP